MWVTCSRTPWSSLSLGTLIPLILASLCLATPWSLPGQAVPQIFYQCSGSNVPNLFDIPAVRNIPRAYSADNGGSKCRVSGCCTSCPRPHWIHLPSGSGCCPSLAGPHWYRSSITVYYRDPLYRSFRPVRHESPAKFRTFERSQPTVQKLIFGTLNDTQSPPQLTDSQPV